MSKYSLNLLLSNETMTFSLVSDFLRARVCSFIEQIGWLLDKKLILEKFIKYTLAYARLFDV